MLVWVLLETCNEMKINVQRFFIRGSTNERNRQGNAGSIRPQHQCNSREGEGRKIEWIKTHVKVPTPQQVSWSPSYPMEWNAVLAARGHWQSSLGSSPDEFPWSFNSLFLNICQAPGHRAACRPCLISCCNFRAQHRPGSHKHQSVFVARTSNSAVAAHNILKQPPLQESMPWSSFFLDMNGMATGGLSELVSMS